MLPKLHIHVDGHGSSFRTAERGYLRLAIACTSPDQSLAFREAQAAAAKITTSLRALAPKAMTADGSNNHPHPDAAVTAFTVTPLSTTSRYPRDQYFRELTSQPKEHTVSASAEAIFRDMARLADVSNELATMPHVSVRGTEWRLTEATRLELEREARLKAIRDAVAKARDYAGVVGREVVAVEIRDVPQPAGGLGGGVGRGWGPAGGGMQQQMMQQQMPQQQMAPGQGGQMAIQGGGAAAVAAEGPSLEPKTITVSAAVTAKFVSVDGVVDDMEVVQ